MLRNCSFLIVSFLLAGCASETPSDDATASASNTITDNAAQSDVAPDTPTDANEEEPVFVIDVRSKEEWDSGHIESASHIPHTEIADRISEVTDDKDAKIVVYCRVGGRAGIAKEALEKQGFTNVENGGGFDDVKTRF